MARTILSFLGLGLAAVAATGATAALTGMAGPEAIAAAAALGGVAGNFTTELCKVLHRPVAERWREGRSGIDENHHVASALRLAQLKALGVVASGSMQPGLSSPIPRGFRIRIGSVVRRNDSWTPKRRRRNEDGGTGRISFRS
jgi:hypothetical protein